MLPYRWEWHLKGTFIWLASLLSVVTNISLILVVLLHHKRYSPATIYTVAIAVGGLGIVAMEQETFIKA